ncbi:glycosyltransferase, partial [Xanthomonas vasicola]
AFVASPREGRPVDGDMDALATRWPAWHARLASFLMHDPLRAQRDQLAQLLADLPPPDPQRTLFDALSS